MDKKAPKAKYEVQKTECALCKFFRKKLIFSVSKLHAINSLTGEPVIESCELFAKRTNMEEKNKFLEGFCKICLSQPVSPETCYNGHKERACNYLYNYPGQRCKEAGCYRRSSLCFEHEEKNRSSNKKKQRGFINSGIEYVI